MKIIKKHIYTIISIALLGIYSLYSSSCASTRISPSGGPKDTIPPIVVAMYPDSNATNFPIEHGEIELVFNEYVQIKDAFNNILLSPPQKKPVEAKIKKKSIIVKFKEPLNPNTTYSLNFGNAIVDNNENNPLYGYCYSFSTGNTVDSMMITGTVVDAVTLFPVEGATVALYLNANDSTLLTRLPDAVARSDKWGFFAVRNLKKLPYSVYAFIDGNNNKMYDRGSESVAFLDTLITPSIVMHKDIGELSYIDPKDTLAALSRNGEIDLAVFTEKATNQFIKSYKRFTKRGAYIKFNAANVQIDSFAIAGIENHRIIKQFNNTNDSLLFWIKGDKNLKDTLQLSIKYHKTDTTGNLSPFVEKLKLIAPFEKKKNIRDRSENKEDEKRKDLLEFTLEADVKYVEQNGIVLIFKEPLIEMKTDTISFTMRTPKRIESKVKFSVIQDSIEINKYTIIPQHPYVKGNDYTVIFPQATFKDINGFTNDSTNLKISLPTDDNLSSLTLELTNVDARYIVELIDETRSKLFRKFVINEDTELLFPYLQKGKYSIRITEDLNENGLFDTGDILQRKQPEKVLLYTLPDGSNVLQINDKTDLVQNIDISQLFRLK